MNRFVEAASRLETLSDEEMSHWAVDEATAAHRAGTSIGSKYYHLLSGKFLPAIGYSLCEAKRDLARHDVTACGIAAELYRLDHGTYPLSLDMLAPKYLAAVPQDVFSGKPLLFESLPNGVLIQSVGPYQRRLGDSESVPPTPPITWRIERPSPAQP